MKKLIYSVAILLAIVSCSEDKYVNNGQDNRSTLERRDQLKFVFGKALSKALTSEPALRTALREEALKMFDNDYDVLYHLVKDREIQENSTFRDLLLRYFKDESELVEIEKLSPLLTIFIPQLPEGSFSANLWNPEIEIPSVGISSFKTNDVVVIAPDGNQFVVKANMIPDFPVVVVKENERIVKVDNTGAQATGRVFRASDNLEFQFLADCFDATLGRPVAYARRADDLDPKIKSAYLKYNTLGVDGWQRDYIYYGISPDATSGQFDYSFQERVRSFKLIGDPTIAYNKISDQTSGPLRDPRLLPGAINYPENSGWTDGFFEFKVHVLYNAKNGVGADLPVYFGVDPKELFNVVYLRSSTFPFLYRPNIVSLTEKALSLSLFSWDLDNYASTIKIEIEEVDLTETYVLTDERQVKFATNFAIEGTVLKKVGLKFGASLEVTQTQRTQVTYSTGSDLLGSVIINFGDDVLVDYLNNRTREYTSGYFSISVEPTRVQ